MTQQQFQKNPNGGYLKASSHGEGRETAVLEFTPEIINELFRQSQMYGMGYIRANVSELKAGRFGNYRRATMKALTDTQINNHRSAKSNSSAAPVQQPIQQQAQPVQQMAPAPQQPVSVQQPVAQVAHQAQPVMQQQAPMQQINPAAEQFGNTVTAAPQPVAQQAAAIPAFVEDEVPF